MIYCNHNNFKRLLPAALIATLLTACGGGGGGGGSGDTGGGFTATSTTNTKPQISSEASVASSEAVLSSSAISTSSAAILSSTSSSQLQSSKSSASSSSKSSQSQLSISSKSSSSPSKPTSSTDTTPPANPSQFYVASAFSDAVFLSWTKTTDNVAVVAYKLYRDGIQIADLEEIENYYADYNVAPGRSYTYGVSVGDAAGNWSTITALSTTIPVVVPSSSSASSTSKASTMSTSSISSISSASSSVSVSSKASVLSTSSTVSSKSSVSSSKSSSSNSSSSANAIINVLLQWQRPIFRENGNDFFDYEVGGYELRYRPIGSTNFISVKIGPAITEYVLSNLVNNTEFEIATFDNNNLYSRFVPIHPL